MNPELEAKGSDLRGFPEGPALLWPVPAIRARSGILGAEVSGFPRRLAAVLSFRCSGAHDHRSSHAGAGGGFGRSSAISRPARQPRPFDRALAFLDPLFARAALVVERDHALGRAAHVRHDEADARIKFFGMPLDLGNHPPRLGPGSSLIAEIGMEPPDFIGRSSDRTLEQVANPTLQDLVGRQRDRIL